MTVLAVRDLYKSFGGVRAVDGVTFGIDRGELLALIGPNGAGKSTCFNMIGGQLRPDAGDILFEGSSIAGVQPRQIWRLGVGRTFQVAATFASMTVIENVQLALASHHGRLHDMVSSLGACRRREAQELLAQVGIAQAADRACRELAYGEVKRVELAIALANDPRLLLMDEPTAGMGPRERLDMITLVKRLVAERGVTVLFTEHSMDVVFALADRIIVMARGALIAEGDAAAIRNNAQVQEVYLGTGKTYASPDAAPTLPSQTPVSSPAKAGDPVTPDGAAGYWIPAFAGMTPRSWEGRVGASAAVTDADNILEVDDHQDRDGADGAAHRHGAVLRPRYLAFTPI